LGSSEAIGGIPPRQGVHVSPASSVVIAIIPASHNPRLMWE
jgi:hypothetical protein